MSFSSEEVAFLRRFVQAMKAGGSVSPSEAPHPTPPPPVTGPSKEVLATPQSGSLASINNQQLSDELDRAAWRENSNGKGWHVKFDDLPQPIRAKLAGKLLNEADKSGYLHLNGFVYKRFGDEGRMLARYATKAGDLTK